MKILEFENISFDTDIKSISFDYNEQPLKSDITKSLNITY